MQIEASIATADAQYRSALERYPKSSRLLRAYARFLQDIRNDPGQAQKLMVEAEKLESIAASAASAVQVGDNGKESLRISYA